MANKNALLRKKIDGIMYDLMLQSTGDIVMLSDGSTLNVALAKIFAAFSKIVTESTIDTMIANSNSNLYSKIMGIDDTTTVDEAYDTIKEIADWMTNVDEEGNSKTVQDIVNDIKKLQEDVETITSTATKVEKSDNNGSIKVDNVDVTVYTHPDTHSAEMIEETEERKFVTPAEKTFWNGAETMVHYDASNDQTDYAGMEEVDSCTISIDPMEVAITYKNVDSEDITVADGKTSVTAEVGSSLFETFTVPEGYEVTSITLDNGTTQTPVLFTVDYKNMVRYTITNVGSLTYDASGIPSYKETCTVNVLLTLISG